MRYLVAALIAEGPSDDRFLPPLFTRGLEELCMSAFVDSVEVADVRVLRKQNRPPTIEETVELIEENADSFTLVFFHRDQGAVPERVHLEWLRPLKELWGDRLERLVPIVPVRETEAWMLADGDALRRVLGVKWSDDVLGVPSNPELVEQIEDPKQVLKRLGDRVRRPIDSYFERLGGLVSLDVLSAVPAFAHWRADTRRTLLDLGFCGTGGHPHVN